MFDSLSLLITVVPPPDQVHERAGALRRHVELELALEAVQLLHEMEVGRNVRLARPDQVKGVVQVKRALVHEVGDGDGD